MRSTQDPETLPIPRKLPIRSCSCEVHSSTFPPIAAGLKSCNEKEEPPIPGMDFSVGKMERWEYEHRFVTEITAKSRILMRTGA